jgi:quercetin dioxygenase-like cupin family protein
MPAEPGAPPPRLLHHVDTAVGAGVEWHLAEAGRQLDANVIRLAAGQVVDTHTETELDVLLVVVSGSGRVEGDEPLDLAPGALVWLPRGSTRSLHAGGDGLGYLTVHRRRAGMRISTRPS